MRFGDASLSESIPIEQRTKPTRDIYLSYHLRKIRKWERIARSYRRRKKKKGRETLGRDSIHHWATSGIIIKKKEAGFTLSFCNQELLRKGMISLMGGVGGRMGANLRFGEKQKVLLLVREQSSP